MRKIETWVLNPPAVADAEQMMVCAARLTQKGHKIKNLDDFMELYEKDYAPSTAVTMVNLPHPTIQKFGTVNVVVVGASRRFLAQITRHQSEVKFMSASLQYSDYSGDADFVVPYDILEKGGADIENYLYVCREAMDAYTLFVRTGIGNDAAGYMAPQGLRNILIISATPYQWKHMIGQRICRRNTAETRYVLLRIWEQLYGLNPIMFAPNTTGPFCLKSNNYCPEGNMTCGRPIWLTRPGPEQILADDFPLLCT